NDHITIRRVRNIAQKCSDNLYSNKEVPLEHIEIISVIIEEFVDEFHHGKEEQAYFPETKDKDNFAEDVRKFLIEHELGRRIANMLRKEITIWKDKENSKLRHQTDLDTRETNQMEPIARFLKSYAVFIDDHTGKEDKFFDLIESKGVLTSQEDENLMKHYELCKNQVGGKERIEEMTKLIEYLEGQNWMKSIN
ncbi:MAG TPA: hemerythrin domain-containing protein, partial [Candidatus Nitrosocosmicus sp.]|nr:hemerythrin domain-containing protein [Candidatus Nitrosocosmicus sp.]